VRSPSANSVRSSSVPPWRPIGSGQPNARDARTCVSRQITAIAYGCLFKKLRTCRAQTANRLKHQETLQRGPDVTVRIAVCAKRGIRHYLIVLAHRVIKSMSAAGVVFVRRANTAKSAIVISRSPASIRLKVLSDICSAVATSFLLRSASLRAPESTAAMARFQRLRKSSVSFRKRAIRVVLARGAHFAMRYS
jgi:hypothetical protein